jgi:hypothetical protein
VPAIHVGLIVLFMAAKNRRGDVDGRDKPGHDDFLLSRCVASD